MLNKEVCRDIDQDVEGPEVFINDEITSANDKEGVNEIDRVNEIDSVKEIDRVNKIDDFNEIEVKHYN